MIKHQIINSIEDIDICLQHHSLVLLYVSQEECSVCHAILPKLMKLLTNYPHIQFIQVDAKQVTEVAGRFLIFSVPTFIMFYEQKELFRDGRFVQFESLENRIQQIYNSITF
ncbi:thioredoxin family protein [Paenibacillus xylanexedens]|uniref:thioredoxin family protein n=1 Tax=Paenibacillus xylanexedens TaxID=528191 RepID=UPI0011A0FEB4|nr:thioredoxin family protein [Paenibacillus xylanexedens]